MCCTRSRPRTKTWASCTLVLILSGHVAAGADIGELREQWAAQEYETVLPRLLEYQSEPYGRNEEVFYMIATSACRLPGMQALGARCFDWILENYRLDEASRAKVRQESESCESTGQPLQVSLAAANRTTSGTAGISSKMFHWLDMENVPLGDDSARVVEQIDPAEFRARLFPWNETEAAIAKVSELVGPGFVVTAETRFVLASRSEHSSNQLEAIGDELGRVVDFYAAFYNMPQPEYLVSVYLVPYVGALRNLSLRLHGIEITDSSIGYSYRDDMSVLAVIPGETLGTLKHELFHLLVRNSYGDIPPWLDEGMAALYEVSEFSDGQLRGAPNWRGPVLERFWEKRPSIAELVDADWPELDAVAVQGEKKRFETQAANHATARYFVLFLQERDRLADVYERMHARSPIADPETVPTGGQVLEQTLGQDLDDIDRAFADWFNTQVALHVRREDVRKYQRLLADKGYDPQGVDGVMGSNTRIALRQFQADHGLRASGELDLYTRQALRQAE